MVDKIYAGDDGTVCQYTVKDKGVKIDITGCTITVDFRVRARTFTKTATITDALNGICEVTLSSDNIADSGTYFMVGFVDFNNGRSFHSDKDYFNVEDATV